MSPHWWCCMFAAAGGAYRHRSRPSHRLFLPANCLGREREQFVQPRVPLSQPGGRCHLAAEHRRAAGRRESQGRRSAACASPAAPSTARRTSRRSTRTSSGANVPLTAVYDIAQRITAKYGSDGYVLSRAIVPPQELSPSGAIVHIQIVEGYIDQVEWPASLSKYRDFFSYYAAKITAERPINVRTLERYLLLAGDLPGPEVQEQPEGLGDPAGRRHAGGRGGGEADRLFRPRRQSRHQGARPAAVFQQPDHQQSSAACTNPGRSTTPAHSSSRSCNTGCVNYRQVLTSEGLTMFFNDSYSRSRPGTEIAAAAGIQDPQRPVRRRRELSVHPPARDAT